MDCLQDWEVYDLYECLPEADILSWEQTRFLMYMTAQVNSQKTLDLHEIMTFPWEQQQEAMTKVMTESDVEELREKAEVIKNMLINLNG